MIGPLSFLGNDNRAPACAGRRSETGGHRAEALEPSCWLIKSHLCGLRLSYSIPFPGHAGAVGARSRATSIKIS